MMQEKAKGAAKELGIENFKASNGRIKKFLVQHKNRNHESPINHKWYKNCL